MAKWWDTDMVDASQTMFQDPNLAMELALTPDKLLMTQQQQQEQMKLQQEQKAGFWQNAIESGKKFLGKTDKALSNIPGFGVFKQGMEAVWYPIDKTAQGMRWLYSEAFSQPFSTLILQAAKEDMDVGSFFSGADWSESYREANEISPGQAFMNAEMTAAARGDFGALSIFTDQVEAPDWTSRVFTGENWKYTGPLSEEEREQVRRQTKRFLYDKDFWTTNEAGEKVKQAGYWESKDAETYNKGSGALDFYFVLFGDPSSYLTGGVINTIKAARSAQFVDDGLGLVRTRGNTLDVAARALPGSKGAPQTAEEFFVADKNMNKFYDWVLEPGASGSQRKTAAEIAAHPVWGRGRRKNPFANQYGEVLATMPRDDMNLVLRFAAGDNAAASTLAGKGTDSLDKIGKLVDNRVMLSGIKFEEDMLSYFATKEDAYPATPVPYAGTQLFTPPTPRPTTPGPRQSGWDARWGELQAKSEIHAAAAEHIRGGLAGGVRPIGPVGGINSDDIAKANQWRTAKLNLIDQELAVAQKEDNTLATLLGWNAGKPASEFEAGAADLFGTMDRAYRAGGLGLRSSEKSADSAIVKASKDRKGRFATQGYRKGFYGTPMRFVQSFGDRVPGGRINHTDSDAPDRVMDMLKQVPGLGTEQRLQMLDRYMTAGDKTAKSRMLEQLNTEIVHHIAGRVHGLDPEVAQVLSEITSVGINATLSKLTKSNVIPQEQAFGPAELATKQHAAKYIEDGEVWNLGPMAKTQLSSTDTLLPILELNRVIGRASGSLKTMRNAGGTAIDSVKLVSDTLNSAWKAATLLRPGYVPRMISEEAMASAIKFGFMSRLLADPSIGAKNFVLNRAQQVAAVTGFGSYVPSTGAGAASKHAVIRLESEEIGERALAYRKGLDQKIAQEADPYKKSQLVAERDAIKVKRVRVNQALPVVQTRISMERELMDNLKRDVENYKLKIKELEKSQLATDALKVDAYRIKIANAEDDIIDHQNMINEFTDYSDEIMRVAAESVGKRLGEGEFYYGDRSLTDVILRRKGEAEAIPQAFSKDWANPIPREQISSNNAFQSLYARGENIDMGRAMKTGAWTHIGPDRPEHMESWLRAINFQFRQDDLFRLVAEDPTGKKAISWLKTPDGKNHLRDLGPRARNGKQLVEDIKFTLDKYLPVEALQQKMAKGEEVTAGDIVGNIPKEIYPIVHGEEIKYVTRMFAKDANESIVDRIVAAGFKRLGSIPSDLMSRNPVYTRFFEMRMRTMLGQDASMKASQGKGKEFTPQELERMKDKADKLARKDMSQIVYDPNRTMGGEALRFIFPFFNAHADGLARWAGLMGERPQEFSKLAKIYNAPVSANMVTDKYGNVLDSDGTVTVKDPKTGAFIEKHKVNIEDRVLQLRLPWKTSNEGATPVKLSAINTILPGDPWFHPGSGPMVQVPASQIAKASPQAGDFMQWAKIIPYGPQDTLTSITPKYIRAIWDRYKAGDPDGEAYQDAFLASYNRRVADYHTSGQKFTIKEVEEDARKFLNLEILTSWASPAQTTATPLTGSPYQFYVDEYKKMLDVYGGDAKDVFLEKHGSDYFTFTASLNKSMGIAASHSADAMAQKYKDLIEMDPDMAPFIIGNVYNGGPFSTSVYKKQLEESFGGEWVREKITAKDAITANQIEQGWREWEATKLQIDATLIRAGFTSYTQKGAEGINQIRANAIANLSQAFPGWGEEYSVADRGKIPQRIEAFERLSMDERLLTDDFRPEIKMLRHYLNRRALFKQALGQRGASQLSYNVNEQPTGKNADIAAAWDREVTGMLNSNLAFNQLYNRYLTNDRLQ